MVTDEFIESNNNIGKMSEFESKFGSGDGSGIGCGCGDGYGSGYSVGECYRDGRGIDIECAFGIEKKLISILS